MSRSLTRLQAILLGGVVSAALLLTTVGVFAVGNRQWLWNDMFHVTVGFAQIRGVEVGTRVRIQGIEAGEVERVEPPAVPGGEVLLHLRLGGHLRSLLRADATAQIVTEGMIGGKVVEIDPGSAAAPSVADQARIASRTNRDLSDVLGELHAALEGIRNGQGTVGKFMTDPEAYAQVVTLLQQSHETLASFQQDAEALKRLPVVRSYIEDTQALLIRPSCDRNRQWFTEADLFEPGRAVLTAEGRQRLDDLGPWLAGLKCKGSDVVIAAYADPKRVEPGVARTLTKEQSEAVLAYLKRQHSVQKLGWFSWRKVTALGLGTAPPPQSENAALPAGRIEVLVFVPQT